jgi:hypothetical protein
MKILKFVFILCMISYGGAYSSLFAKDSTANKVNDQSNADSVKVKQLFLITKLNETEYIGEILSDDGHEVLINTENLGKIYITKSEIKAIAKVEGKNFEKQSEIYNTNPFSSHYVLSNNALGMKKGTNYGVLSILGPEAHFAVTDNLSIGIMSPWIASPIAGIFRYSLKTKNKNIHFSIGTILGTSGYIGNFDVYGGLPFANITLGDSKKNITLTAGYGFIGSFSNPSYSLNAPVVSIAGITPIGLKASFIFDGMYCLPTANTLTNFDLTNNTTNSTFTKNNLSLLCLMPGIRFQSKENSAFQIALAGIIASDLNANTTTTIPYPIFSWFFRF